ncbi:Transmembrane protein 255B [Triplophysa tibetana]|uniref:Transmembrane protein 255B n=1 Tax=Triplophysa tibetana TaxID=1572043 RepID=A0A5A9P1Q7_9TELE|nr:Transmembrane protein 255B [Triplophysa tibetana]
MQSPETPNQNHTVKAGIYSSTRTESVSITGYTSGIILVAAIVFLSFGIISSFLCLVVDGVFILLTIDVRPLKGGRCQFYTSGNSYIYENYYATSCQDVLSLYVVMWVLSVLNLLGFLTGILTTAVLGSIKDMSCQDVLSLYVVMWVLSVLNLLGFLTGILTTAVLGSIKDMYISSFIMDNKLDLLFVTETWHKQDDGLLFNQLSPVGFGVSDVSQSTVTSGVEEQWTAKTHHKAAATTERADYGDSISGTDASGNTGLRTTSEVTTMAGSSGPAAVMRWALDCNHLVNGLWTGNHDR